MAKDEGFIVRGELFRDHRVERMSRLLYMDVAEVVGRLLFVWDWYFNHQTQATAARVTTVDITMVARCASFGSAMRTVGFLADDGKLTVPQFLGDRLNNKLAGSARSQKKAEARLAARTPLETILAIPVPIQLDTQEFRAKWNEWCAKRWAHPQKPYGERSARLDLKTLASCSSLPVAIDAIERAIAEEWLAIYPPKEGIANGRQRPREEPGRVAAAPGQYDELALTEDDWREKMRARNPPPPEGG